MIPYEVWASPEPTIARIGPRARRNQLAETGHLTRESDLDALASLGVSATRYPVLWEATAPDDVRVLDLRWARRRLGRLRELGIEPVVTLLHHGSGPAYTDLLDPAFPELLARYAGAVAAEFPWVRRWTPVNEPLTTARFSTLYGTWYPNRRDDAAFGRAIVHEMLGLLLAMEAIRTYVPDAQCVLTEDLQGFTSLDPRADAFVAHKRRRAYLSADLACGHVVPGHDLYRYLVDTCAVAPALLDRIVRHARPPDVLGWNYYPNSERAISVARDGSYTNDARRAGGPISPRPLLRAADDRYGLPFGLSEVHADAPEDARVAWLHARADDLCALAAEGRPVRMLGAWAAFGLVDWHSLLRERADYREDGIYTFAGRDGTPRETAVARAVRDLAARATPSAFARAPVTLPA